MKCSSTLAVAALCFSAFAALAQDAVPPAGAAPERTPEQKARYEACKADAAKLCATELAANPRVKGAVSKCLESHTSELSEACKTARAATAAEKAKAQ